MYFDLYLYIYMYISGRIDDRSLAVNRSMHSSSLEWAISWPVPMSGGSYGVANLRIHLV